MGSEFLKAERIPLKGDTERSERWVQDIIEKDPSILGIGDLVLRASEKKQPRAGRLDLLLQDPDTKQRYEVELQLGPTDETHIIRTIEYWDIERKRYPQYVRLLPSNAASVGHFRWELAGWFPIGSCRSSSPHDRWAQQACALAGHPADSLARRFDLSAGIILLTIS